MSGVTIDVYDFDKTIYDGDASRDFLVFCLRTQPAAWREVPLQIWAAVLFALGQLPRDRFKERSFAVLRRLPDPAVAVDEFWRRHRRKLAPWYTRQCKESDVIISASPEFLLAPVIAELGGVLIGTRMDPNTGLIDGDNCRGEEKVRRLRAAQPDAVVDRAYSDSLTDLPILRLARRPYIVRKGVATLLDQVLAS
jgi:phosphatidylglycerophosphatase C